MPVTVQPVFGTFDYEANDAEVERFREDDTVRAAVAPIPRSDIARAVDSFLAPRQVVIEGTIGPDGGGDREQLRTAVDAFKWAHRPGHRQLYRDTDRYLNAEVRSVTLGDDTGLSWVPFVVRFECADPFWYATAADPTDNWAGPLSGATRSIANGGSATAQPVFTITIGSTGTLALDLFNDTTGKSFGLDGAVTAGDVLVVDCAAQTVKLNGSNKLSYFSGDFWTLDPGNNTLRVVLAGVTLTSIATAWTKRWL